MKKKFLIYILLITGSLLTIMSSFAQKEGKEKIDSIISVLKIQREDTAKANTFNALAFEFRNSNPDTGIYFAEKALSISKKLDYKIGIADAQLTVGIAQSNIGKYEDALKSLIDALAAYNQLLISENARYKSTLLNKKARVYNIIGINYFSQSDYPNALEYYFKSLKIRETLGDQKGLSENYNNIGTIYSTLSDYLRALEYYFKSLKIKEVLGDKKGIAKVYMNIGAIYFVQTDSDFVKQQLVPSERYPMAVKYYLKSLNIREAIDDKQGMSMCYINIGEAYADFFAEDSLHLGLNVPPDSTFGVMASSNKALFINHLALLDSSLVLQRKALAINNELDDIFNSTYSLLGIGQVYFLEKKYKEAIRWFHQSFSAADNIDALDEKKEAAKHLSDSYKKLKDFENAMTWHETYTALKDSVFNEEKTHDITRKEMNYEFDKKVVATKAEQDKKDALAKAEIKRQTLIRNSTFGGVGIVGIFSFLLVRSVNRRRKTSFEKQVSEVEMTALRSQMNPHFIFNSLHSINNYVLNNDKKNASDYLGKFSKLMRLILENSREQEVPLEKDLLTLELYMELEAMRFENKFSYKIEVADDLDPENTLVPPMILQPFVENSILHGLQHKESEGKIVISVKKENDMIVCTVEDNGVGREKAMEMKEKTSTHKGESLGMKITNARIDIINKIKKAKASVNLTDLSEGMRVEVKLPFELAF
ncbi:MAG: tetratricopeptide repeat protein [Bacteroidia bacterium]